MLTLVQARHAELGLGFDEEEGRKAVATLLGDPDLGRIQVVEVDGAVVGYLALTVGFDLELHGRTATVESFLHPERRDDGAAAALTAAIDEARTSLGVRALQVAASDGDAATWRAAGFTDRNRTLLVR